MSSSDMLNDGFGVSLVAIIVTSFQRAIGSTLPFEVMIVLVLNILHLQLTDRLSKYPLVAKITYDLLSSIQPSSLQLLLLSFHLIVL